MADEDKSQWAVECSGSTLIGPEEWDLSEITLVKCCCFLICIQQGDVLLIVSAPYLLCYVSQAKRIAWKCQPPCFLHVLPLAWHRTYAILKWRVWLAQTTGGYRLIEVREDSQTSGLALLLKTHKYFHHPKQMAMCVPKFHK